MAITLNSVNKPGSGSYGLDFGTFGANLTPAPSTLLMMEMASGAQVVNVGKDIGSFDSTTNNTDTIGDDATGDSYAAFTPANSDSILFGNALGITAYPYSVMAIFRCPADPTADATIWSLADVSAGNVEQGVYVGSNAKVVGRRRNTTAFTKAFSNADFADNAWHIVIYTAVSPTEASISVDGGTYVTDVNSVAFAAGNDEFAIGVRNDLSPSNYFEGHITTLAVWKGTEITQSNITDIWAAPWGYLSSSKRNVVVAVKEITAASKANPCQITATAHGMTTGQLARIFDLGGMTELNDGGDTSPSPDDGLLYYSVTRIDNDTLTLGVDSTAYTTYTSGGFIAPGLSLFEDASPAVVDGDVAIVDSLTSPDSYAITLNADGTLSYAAGGDDARQSLVLDVFDSSASALMGTATYYFNNKSPSLIGAAIPSQTWIKNQAITPIVGSVYVEDFEGDVLSSVITGNPGGISETANTISGTPTLTLDDGEITWTFTDAIGDTTVFLVQYEVLEPVVGNVSFNWSSFIVAADFAESA